LDSVAFVVPPDSRSLRKVLSLPVGESFSWAYLGESVEEFARVEQCFLGRGDHVDTARSVQLAAETLRNPYLTYLYDIGRQLNSLLWWLTSLSYRCGYHSGTFLQACFLKTGLELLGDWEGPKPLVLVVSDGPLRRAFQLNVPRREETKVEFIGLGRVRPSVPALSFAKVLARRTYFVLRQWRRMFQARRALRRPYVPREPTTLLLSSFSPRNADRGADFHTFFFGDLGHKLSDLGIRVALMPLVLREVPFGQALADTAQATFPVCVPHRYLKFTDVLRAATGTIAKPPVVRPVPQLSGMEIGPLVEEELDSHWVSNRSADDLLLAAAVRRFADLGSKVDRIIYVYENQPWERALCWQVRRSFPQAKLVGYQHSRAPRMLLNLYLAPGGEKEAPLPDRVVTVGEHTARMFASDGYAPGVVRSGGALPLVGAQIPVTPAKRVPGPEDGAVVLVAPSMGRQEASELVELAIQLYTESEGVRVVIKCHPTMSFTQITGTRAKQLPGHVEVSDEPIDALMAKSSVMIYTGSTVCIQALAMGLPVVHLSRQFGLNLDPLEADSDARLDAVGLEDLREKVRYVLDNREQYIASRREAWNRLVDDMYGPVTQQTYLAFVE